MSRADRVPGSWDTFTPVLPRQSLWVSLGVLFAVPGLVLTCLRLVPPTDDAPALVASFISYAVLPYLAALVCLGIAWWRAATRTVLGVLAAVTAGLLLLHVCWLAPFFVPDDRPATTAGFTLLSLNVHLGTADAAQLAQRAATADVVVLLEATPPSIGALQPYGWSERFPYSVGQVQSLAGGTVIYSRYPVSESSLLVQSKFSQWTATVATPQVGPIRIIAAHPCNPYCGGNRWRAEHAQLRDVARANLGRPLIVAGDLNAVDEHGPLLQLRRDGLESATDVAGAGWLPTYPADRAIPALLPIDHILLNRFLTATSVRRVRVADTDHLGLVARIARA